MKRISSRDNPAWKALVQLAQSSRERRKQGRCVLEGAHTIRAYMERFGQPESLVVDAAAVGDPEHDALIAAMRPAAAVVADSRLFGELAQTATPTGMVAVARVPQPRSTTPGAFAVMLEDVQDPGNVGTILRSAAAAGVTHVVLTPGCAFAWSPKVLRAAQGAHFFVDIVENADLIAVAGAYAQGWADASASARRGTTATGSAGRIVAAVPRNAPSVFDTDLRGPTLFLVGNEGNGLSTAALATATARVRIPMPGGFESLNAATAAAVCLFEKVRQDEATRDS
jgi:TrmH family RNA methyltransferase